MIRLAIVCIAYNRVDSLSRLLASLDKAEYLNENVDLIISIDKSKTDVVENFADDYKWRFGAKIVKKHSENLGLRKHILSQGQELNNYDAIIVLEDDVIVSPAFYKFARQTVCRYKDCDKIAGISLYSFPMNLYTDRPFEAYKDGNDVFFMQNAQSWGQIWMKSQWDKFFDWYLHNEAFEWTDNIPHSLFKWNRSWLKYHTRFCIETKRYFVYPYFSFSSNCGESGVHSKQRYNNYQTVLQTEIKDKLILPLPDDNCVVYDAFFENEALSSILGYEPDEFTSDLNAYKNLDTHKRFLLTPLSLPYKVLRSFGLSKRPIESNIIDNEPGEDIFLYDTSISFNAPKVKNWSARMLLYSHRLPSALYFIKKYGVISIVRDFISKIRSRIF